MKQIIVKEKRLIKKLQILENLYRIKGFHFEISQKHFEEVSIDLRKYIKKVPLPSFDELSYKMSSNTDTKEINRIDFPILIRNRYGTENISSFKEVVRNSDVIFKYGSLEIYVNQKYYESVRLVLESYLKFTESPKFSEILTLKVPNKRVLEIYKIQKQMLESKLTQITPEDKNLIETTIHSILEDGKAEHIKEINSIREILYFIDLAIITMIASDYKEEILTY